MSTNSIQFECITPRVCGGDFAVKRTLGDQVTVQADVFTHGHAGLRVRLLYRPLTGGRKKVAAWRTAPMKGIGNDRWEGVFEVDALGEWEFSVEARLETYASWAHDTERKRAAGQDIASDLVEGAALVRLALDEPAPEANAVDEGRMRAAVEALSAEMLLAPAIVEAVEQRAPAAAWQRAERAWQVRCERERARFGAWYEMFPRSQGTDATRSATFSESEARLDEIAGLGFDVVYLPPIHPIGHTKRKGPNNTLMAGPGDPGSPYAIGSDDGGHDAIEPGLGTLADFDHFLAAAKARGMEVALDFAINCSPDHPYVKRHPEWFFHRPDGSIKYAENPPKRYEDIYPLDLDGPHAATIAKELHRILRFWARRGVRIFRVDNPHTKPMAMWSWLLSKLRGEFPDLVFLSEAFTRPKPMKYLAKLGYSQSYTYFTWRNAKQELTDYLNELAIGPAREYFRPNFFVNTPDILPPILQTGGRPAFLSRLVLAATLSPSWGMYNGYELCENRAIPGSEEYQDSEKYQFKVWDWDRPGNIKDWIGKVNCIRREHPALHHIGGLQFLQADNDQLLLYARHTPDFCDLLVIAVNLDPYHKQAAPVEFPIERWGIGPEQGFEVTDLLAGPRGVWRGRQHYLELEPGTPAAVLHLVPCR